jgi:hypothetical protein
MTTSTKLMVPGTAFCSVGMACTGLALYVTAIIGIALIVIGLAFWIFDKE